MSLTNVPQGGAISPGDERVSAYIARRLLLAAFTIWAISVLAFVIIRLPEGHAADRSIDTLMQEGQGSDPRIAAELGS